MDVNMDIKENKASPERDKTENQVSFSHISAVVTDWMLDFLLVSLYQNFKDGDAEEFNKNMNSFQVLSDDLAQSERVLVCAFLGRVMHGKQLDVFFEEDNKVTPLMSAARIWSDLKGSVEDEILAKNMTVLLCVQSVAVCLESGRNASSVIKWFEKNIDIPSTLRVKLGTIVIQKNNYHSLIKSFSYSRLLETTQAFLDAFLEKNPSDYLLKEGRKAVQSSGEKDTVKGHGLKNNTQTSSKESTAGDKVNGENTCARSKRKLLSTNICDLWASVSTQKPSVKLTRISKDELPKDVRKTITQTRLSRKTRSKWTPEEDRGLIAGVRRHGVGRWSHILLDFDFGERTGTMLKDRWRTLRRALVV